MIISWRGGHLDPVEYTKGLLVAASVILISDDNLRQDILLKKMNSMWKIFSRLIFSVDTVGFQGRLGPLETRQSCQG